MMKAVILVGGKGTRLRPLTNNLTKAMVPVLNRPFLEHALRYLKKHGVDEVILAMGYLPDPIQEYFGDGSRLGIKLIYMVEETPLGTAGAVKNAEQLLDDTFVVLNGDILTNIDLTAMIKRHFEVRPRASIALTRVDNPTLYGVVETDSSEMVKRFIEKPAPDKVTSHMINAGIYILEPDVLKNVPPATPFMFERQVFPTLLENGQPVLSYPSDAYWIDIGTPEKYLKVHFDLLLAWDSSLRKIRIEGRSKIDPGAVIEGPVLIAGDCVVEEQAQLKGPVVLGAGCYLAKEAVVEGAVLWPNSRVGRGALLTNSILGANSVIEDGVSIPESCVLGDNIVVDTECRLKKGGRLPAE
ncbi:MAG: NDP-sugar synthase [Chloroflexi bacterium]|nr:NDP-sugar synthase [Chloroflexota bacterium]